MGAEIAQLEHELEEKHKKELEEQKKKEEDESAGGDDGAIQQRLEGLSLTSPATEAEGEEGSAAKVGGSGKKSRAQKRKVPCIFSCKSPIYMNLQVPIHIYIYI